MKVSMVMPCYNEEGNLPSIVSRVRTLVAEHADLEFLLVDNGSTDRSAEVFEELLAGNPDPRIRLVRVEVNQGYGYGILAGLKEATGDLLGWTHADMQTDPADAVRAAALFREQEGNGPLLVKGRRKNRGMVDAGFTFGMSVVTWFALGMWLSDINAQPKLFNRAFYTSLTDAPHDFSLDLYILFQARRNRMRIVTVPVVFAKRLHGEAKGGGSLRTKVKLVRRTFRYIFQLRADLARTTA